MATVAFTAVQPKKPTTLTSELTYHHSEVNQVIAIHSLLNAQRGKWDVSSAGTFKPGDEDLGLYICHDRKAVVCNMKKQTNKQTAERTRGRGGAAEKLPI
jgi:hypothetical protein